MFMFTCAPVALSLVSTTGGFQVAGDGLGLSGPQTWSPLPCGHSGSLLELGFEKFVQEKRIFSFESQYF